jgi:RHS repeat-associated protein
MVGGGRKFYYLTDGRGRHLAFTDSLGNNYMNPDPNAGVEHNAYYTEGGNQTGAIESSHGFDNLRGVSDNTPQLSFYRNRYYDQRTGRFISEDPIGLAGGVNLYAYAGNNPVMFTDPFGLCPDSLKTQGSCPDPPRPRGAHPLVCTPEFSGYAPCQQDVTPIDWQACKAKLPSAAVAGGAQLLGVGIAKGAWQMAEGGIFASAERYAGSAGMKSIAAKMGRRATVETLVGGGRLAGGAVLTSAQATLAYYDDAPWLYKAAKFLPALGFGMEIGETLSVCF